MRLAPDRGSEVVDKAHNWQLSSLDNVMPLTGRGGARATFDRV